MFPLVYEDENVEIRLEMFEGLPLIHCEVKKWTVSLYKEFGNIWKDVTSLFIKKGYKNLYAFGKDPKLIRFAKMFGFREDNFNIESIDGKRGRLLIWGQ